MSRNQQIEGTRHGHPLPQVRSASTYFVRGAAIVLVLSVVGLPLNVALGGDKRDGCRACRAGVHLPVVPGVWPPQPARGEASHTQDFN